MLYSSTTGGIAPLVGTASKTVSLAGLVVSMSTSLGGASSVSAVAASCNCPV